MTLEHFLGLGLMSHILNQGTEAEAKCISLSLNPAWYKHNEFKDSQGYTGETLPQTTTKTK